MLATDYYIIVDHFNPLSPHGERPAACRPRLAPVDFNPLSPHGERQGLSARVLRHGKFQSTLPAWGETRPPSGGASRRKYFNPLSPHGERRDTSKGMVLIDLFQSTLPAWGETARTKNPKKPGKFQSTLPAWGETKAPAKPPRPEPFQSTLPAWGETYFPGGSAGGGTDFNPLSPHGERQRHACHHPAAGNFNPLSPHGERPSFCPCAPSFLDFNPLSPHGERLAKMDELLTAAKFQSTLPAWGETWIWTRILTASTDFNPLSPHGERPAHVATTAFLGLFQSTLPAWGETSPGTHQHWERHISIHSPRMGRDRPRRPTRWRATYFNPLSPHGERLIGNMSDLAGAPTFQSTLPAWGETVNGRLIIMIVDISIHSPRMGRDFIAFIIYPRS